MYIVSSYVRAVGHHRRYYFYELIRDDFELRRGFVSELHDVYFARLAQELDEHGDVLLPGPGKIHAVNAEVSLKDWTSEEREELYQSISLLVISKEFADFDPRNDSWILFQFAENRFGSPSGKAQLEQAIDAIVDCATNPDAGQTDLYQIAKNVAEDSEIASGRIFALQPGIFGVSVDLVEIASRLRSMIAARGRRIGSIDRE